MQPAPLFSVILPLYNKERYIERAIRSVVCQTFSDWELIVVDDGSSDNSPRIVERFLQDPRVRLIRQNNTGEGGARNRGLAEMRGSIAAFLDADDEWLPSHLGDIAEIAREFPDAAFLTTGYRQLYRKHATEHSINRQSPALIADYFDFASTGYSVHISSCAVRKEIITAGITFRERAPMGADIEYYSRVGAVTSLAYHPRVSAVYHRAVDGSVMNQAVWRDSMPLLPSMLIQRLSAKNDTALLKNSVSIYLERLIVQHALTGLAAGHKTEALAVLLRNEDYPIGDPGRMRLRRLGRLLSSTPLVLSASVIRFRRSRWWLRISQMMSRGVVESQRSARVISTTGYHSLPAYGQMRR